MSLRLLLPACAGLLILATACGRGFIRQYEYEEQIYLDLDGSATVVVNASVPALVALRGLELDPTPRARFDRRAIRAAFAAPGVRVVRVSRPWRRSGRRFVQVRLEVDAIHRLGAARPFTNTAYDFDRREDQVLYGQTLGPPVGSRVGDVGWTGEELVAIRLHLPSRVVYHNARDREMGRPGAVERGNILTWEQRLADRLRGDPLEIEVRIEPRSILRTTLWIFVLSGTAAGVVLAVAVWWTVRRGRRGLPWP